MRIAERMYRGGHRRPQHSETATVALFVLLGVLVAAGVALSTGAAARRAGAEEADRSFQRLAVVVAGSVVAPLLTPQLLSGGASAAGVLARAVDRLRAIGPVQTVTVRDGEGRLIWTDDVTATAAPLRADQRTALRSGTAVLDPTSTGGSPDDPVRASVGVQGTTGAPLLVEVTGRRENLASAAGSSWKSYAPVALGAVLLLQLLQLPLVLLLARHVRRHRQAAAVLREAAGAATAVERRRIAGEVHDDVLPVLHGLVYELDGARLSRARPDRDAAHPDRNTALLDRTAEGLRSGIRRLRALLLDLSQDRLPETDLAAALTEMAHRMESAGVHVSVQAPDVGCLPRPAAEVLYRCVQEALRNVAAHSGAERVEIVATVDSNSDADAHVTMTIDDDGRGFEGARLAESRADGHLGLRALGDLVADSGGSLTASSSPGQGTRLVVRVPLHTLGDDMRVQQ
ncbi:MAG: histidine kinase [Modestobacter sp.]|nr:histidine kinase [Modestobacter sp.]